jgi:ribosomal protein L7/L12
MASAVKTQVDHVEEQPATLFPDQYVPYQADTVPPELVALVRAGTKMDAIKEYCKQTGVGLDEAKEAVDGLWTQR